MKKILFAAFACLLSTLVAQAQQLNSAQKQAPLSLSCPPTFIEKGDTSVNDSLFWNALYYWDPNLSVHDLSESPIDLKVSTADTCVGGNLTFRYKLFLDLDNNGTQETLVDSDFPPAADTLYFNNNDGDADLTDGTPRAFDFRPLPANQKWHFALQSSVNPATGQRTAALRWNNGANPGVYVLPQLPHGTHQIQWFVADGCGNVQTCSSTFNIRDTKAPSVSCLSGLSVNLLPSKMITLYASDFFLSSSDNCTPADQIKIGVRISGTGTGFPVNGNGDPLTSFTFDCDKIGTQIVELWAIDAIGNADYCESFVIVQDNGQYCLPGGMTGRGGKIFGLGDCGLEEFDINLVPTHPGVPNPGPNPITYNGGTYELNSQLPINGDFFLVPSLDINPLNGVSTYDLVLISRHILAFELLNDPYKMIAADANRSNSITSFDIVELRKLILGIYQNLPNNESYRFVEKAFTFPNPLNPFETPFPSQIPLSNFLDPAYQGDFIGIKVGDINASNCLTSNESDTRSSARSLMPLEDRYLSKGEYVEVPFENQEAIEGCQFTVEHQGLSLQEIQTGAGLSQDNFAQFSEYLTFSNEKPGAFDFKLRFRVEEPGYLSEKLALSSRKTANEAYGKNGERASMALSFQGGPAFALFQNQPNPFSEKTRLSFVLPEAMDVTMSILDMNGRLLWEKTALYPAGKQSEILSGETLGENGVYTCVLKSAKGSFVQKIVKTN